MDPILESATSHQPKKLHRMREVQWQCSGCAAPQGEGEQPDLVSNYHEVSKPSGLECVPHLVGKKPMLFSNR